jgi:hypothetical protein
MVWCLLEMELSEPREGDTITIADKLRIGSAQQLLFRGYESEPWPMPRRSVQEI